MTEMASDSLRPPFVVSPGFIETAFEQRFQTLLCSAWEKRSWHVIAAVPGSGKSLGIDDLVLHSAPRKQYNGKTLLPLLAIRAPKNKAREQALGMALAAAFGVIPPMPWYALRTWLVREMARTEVECIIIDDAHDLELPHLALLKELTDNLAAPPYQRLVGLCLVAATSGSLIPFKETFSEPKILWRQFRRRMDTERPYCLVSGHTLQEVSDILTAFEDLYRSQLPELHLRRWAASIVTWLTNPILDPDGTNRVTMDHLTRLVTVALRHAYEQGATDVDAIHLQTIAELMTVRRDETLLIDDISPEKEV